MQKIQAGHGLDETIAERVIGAVRVPDLNAGQSWHWLVGTAPGWRFPNGRVLEADEELPLYSTDTCATWEVVKTLVASGWRVQLEPYTAEPEAGEWRAIMTHDEAGVTLVELGRTASLAICLAALQAVAVDLDRHENAGSAHNA
jgi:hypothetical protein